MIRGELELFASHWGGITVVKDLFFGSVTSEAFVRGQVKVDVEGGWYDEIVGKGSRQGAGQAARFPRG